MGDTFIGDSFRWIICLSLYLIVVIIAVIALRKEILVAIGGSLMFSSAFIAFPYLIYMMVKRARPMIGDKILGKGYLWIHVAIFGGLFLLGLGLQVLNYFLEKLEDARRHGVPLSYELGRGASPEKMREAQYRYQKAHLQEQMRINNETQRNIDDLNRHTQLHLEQTQRDMEQAQRDLEQHQRDMDNFNQQFQNDLNNMNNNGNNGFPF